MPVVMREIKLVKEENLAAAQAPQVAAWSSLMEHFQRTTVGARDRAGRPAPRR